MHEKRIAIVLNLREVNKISKCKMKLTDQTNLIVMLMRNKSLRSSCKENYFKTSAIHKSAYMTVIYNRLALHATEIQVCLIFFRNTSLQNMNIKCTLLCYGELSGHILSTFFFEVKYEIKSFRSFLKRKAASSKGRICRLHTTQKMS